MANLNFNKVIMGGRMTADPELKTTPGGVSVTSFTIAVNRRFGNKQDEQQADFFNVTAWRQTAEFVTRFFRKASSICVVGSLQTRSWTDQQGMKQYATEIVADEAYFVDSKSETAQTGPAAAYVPEQYSTPAQAPSVPQFEDLQDDEDLPF
jgi:single-strand DNA-binding protein